MERRENYRMTNQTPRFHAGWFQEWTGVWFHNQTEINYGSYGRKKQQSNQNSINRIETVLSHLAWNPFDNNNIRYIPKWVL